MFLKLVEIYFRVTLLYTDFVIFFFSFLFLFKFFGRILSQNLKFSESIKFVTGVHCYMLITIKAFILPIFFFFFFFFFSFKKFWIVLNYYRVSLLNAGYDFDVFTKDLFSFSFLEVTLIQKSDVLPFCQWCVFIC